MSYPDGPVPRPPIPVTMSTSSAFPETLAASFAMAADLGYDGVEVMVLADQATQHARSLLELVDKHQLPVQSIHSPCLLLTSRVWSTDPLIKLTRSIDLAEQVGAQVVVVHPPFLWQRSAAAQFPEAVAELQQRTQVKIAVENMYPVRRRGVVVNTWRPHWDVARAGYQHYTLDFSHTATARMDAVELAARMGEGLAHIHLTDGSGSTRDEHLVPGRGNQKCTEVLEGLRANNYDGAVCVEISTRGLSRSKREDDLAQSLVFARLALDRSQQG